VTDRQRVRARSTSWPSSPRAGAGAVLVGLAVLAPAACGDDGGSPEQLCESLADADGVATQFQGFDPTDPEAALEQLRPARVTLGELLDDAPDEVRDELQTEIDYVQALIDALEEVPAGDSAEAAAQVQAVTTEHPDVAAAAAELAAYADREC
jgi:hypothetical protein